MMVGGSSSSNNNKNNSSSISNNLPWPISALSPVRQRRRRGSCYKYSVERLRVVYADLLHHIDYLAVSPHKNDPRRTLSPDDVHLHRRAHRFSFRRSLVPPPPPPLRPPQKTKGLLTTTQSTASSAATTNAAMTLSVPSSSPSPSSQTNQGDDGGGLGDGDGDGDDPSDDGPTFSPVNEALPRPSHVSSPHRSSSPSSLSVKTGPSQDTTTKNNSNNKLDLAAAFRMLAATRSPDCRPRHDPQEEEEEETTSTTITIDYQYAHHGGGGGGRGGFGGVAAVFRDDDLTVSLQRAKAIEKRVVDLIETLGVIVVNGEMSVLPGGGGGGRSNGGGGGASGVFTVGSMSSHRGGRTDPVFEYFTEKCVLSLLVDIAKEARSQQGTYDASGTSYGTEAKMSSSSSSVHGVVWSGNVKAQVYRTVSMLLADVRNQSILVYLLSNNYVNELIECMLPLQQWTDPAITVMLPAYVDFLKTLTLQLADDPQLFPFLSVQDDPFGTVLFPLFSAALDLATNYHAQADSNIYATTLAVIVNLMQIPHAPIQTWMNHSGPSQRKLANHLCHRLLDLYHRIAGTTTGPVVDGTRHNIIAGQLVSLKDHLRLIHEVFWSGVRGLDVRLCESLLQGVVSALLTNLSPNQLKSQRPFLIVGLVDADIIPESEALAQGATVVLAFMFSHLAYAPFRRMLAVALLHPESSPVWSSPHWTKETFESPEGYVFMPALSDIVNQEPSRETCPNIFRQELVRALQGDCGEWRTTTAACLLQSALKVAATEAETIALLQIISSSGEHHSPIEEAVASFLSRDHPPSTISAQALECVGHLSLVLLYQDLMRSVQDTNDVKRQITAVLAASPVWNALLGAHQSFCDEALRCSEMKGVADIFLDLVESAIKERYTARYNEAGKPNYMCLLSRTGTAEHNLDAEVLVRQLRGVSPNDVEMTRFYIKMSLHFRGLCKVVERLAFSIEKYSKIPVTASPKKSDNTKHGVVLDLVDKADDLCKFIGGLTDEKAEVGADLNLSGRVTFRFQSSLKRAGASVVRGASNNNDSASKSSASKGRLGDEVGVFRSSAHLLLVLDPTDMLVVKPVVSSKVVDNRGTVLCGITLRSVIAAASDGEWLHIAVRHKDIGFLVKNGNMALQFDSPSTCLIVKQYLDRSREVLRQEILTKVHALLRPTTKEI